MFHIDDVVVYGIEGVCKIKEITELRFGKETNEYYVLCPIKKESDTFYVPTKVNNKLRMRRVLVDSEIDEILVTSLEKNMPWDNNERNRLENFKNILLYGEFNEVLFMTRTLYAKQIEQLKNNKKLHASDERYLKSAERLLLDEIGYGKKISENDIIKLITKGIE